jgi:hypothetical protein
LIRHTKHILDVMVYRAPITLPNDENPLAPHTAVACEALDGERVKCPSGLLHPIRDALETKNACAQCAQSF